MDPTAPTESDLRALIGETRLALLDRLSNGRLQEHLQTACKACAGQPVGVAAMHLIQLCGRRPNRADQDAIAAATAAPAKRTAAKSAA